MKTAKKLMLVGKTFAGKTTLLQYLTDRPLEYRKTQALEIIDSQLIDTPGEFLEQRGFTGALIVTSYEADVIVLMQSATDEQAMFPPMFASIFTKPVLGLVSKTDIASDEQIARTKADLFSAGAKKVFEVSSYTGEGFKAFFDSLDELDSNEE